MMTPITRGQAQTVAATISALRPEWDVAGIVKALSDSRDRGSAFDVTIAALNAAKDPKNRTPAVIALAGTHWVTGKPLGEGGPIRFARCQEPGHGSFPAHNCSACIADRIANVSGEKPWQDEREPAVTAERIAQIKAEHGITS